MEAVILEVLTSKGSLKEKKLRKKVFEKIEALGKFPDDKKFDKILNYLLEEKTVLQHNGELALNKVKVEKRKREKDDNLDDAPSGKASKNEDGDDEQAATSTKRWNYVDMWKTGEQHWKDNTLDPEYLRTNPDKITRLFCGNLNRKVTEEELMSCLEGIVYIKWITDKQTGEFYGSSFLEMRDAASAANAVMKDRSKFMGRPLKIYYCPPRPGDVWPPHDAKRGGNNPPTGRGNAGAAGSGPTREKSEKPEGCRKIFVGNLSYDIDDETICEFFKDCGELIGLRWLTRQGTNEFRGCGYVEFSSTDAADRAMALDDHELLGRKIRIDWTN